MTDIKIVASGVCEACGHPQSDHEGNNVCDMKVVNAHK